MQTPSLNQLSEWAGQSVSHEIHLKYQNYLALLTKWNKAINLVSPSTLPDAWERHLADSLQLLRHLPSPCPAIVDLGSGGGFPGLAIAIARPDISVTLMDSDRRKGEFLRSVSRETHLKNTIIRTDRVENLTLDAPTIITARGFAPIATIFQLLAPQRRHITQWLLLKGRDHEVELADAALHWRFETEKYASLTDRNSAILRLSQLQPRE